MATGQKVGLVAMIILIVAVVIYYKVIVKDDNPAGQNPPVAVGNQDDGSGTGTTTPNSADPSLTTPGTSTDTSSSTNEQSKPDKDEDDFWNTINSTPDVDEAKTAEANNSQSTNDTNSTNNQDNGSGGKFSYDDDTTTTSDKGDTSTTTTTTDNTDNTGNTGNNVTDTVNAILEKANNRGASDLIIDDRGPAVDPNAWPRKHTIKTGEYLSTIAQDAYGKASYWRMIIDANPGLDENNLQVGKIITLPAPPQVEGDTASGTDVIVPANAKTYTIKQGDFLSTIAKQFYDSETKWPILVKANPSINPDKLKVGQTIVIPELTEETQTTTQTDPLTQDPTLPDQLTYKVKSGDYLGKIAIQVYGKASLWRLIADANPDVDPANLQVGQVLKIPEQPAPNNNENTSTDTTSIDDPLDLGLGQNVKTYTVKEGDSLWAIAQDEYGNGLLSDLIYNANKSRMKDKNDLKVGQKIIIPPKPQED